MTCCPALEVCPVDYKAGAPKEGEEANEIVGHRQKCSLDCRHRFCGDTGYACNEGVIYYRATKQRVRLPITPELENLILQNIADAKRVIAGPIPPHHWFILQNVCVVHFAPVSFAGRNTDAVADHGAIDSRRIEEKTSESPQSKR